MTTPPPPPKPAYRTFVAERAVAAPRDRLWARLVQMLETGEIGPQASGLGAEQLLSFEPPWRRVARLELPPAPLAEHTVAVRDDGDSCHLVWSYLVEPPAGGGGEAFDALLHRLGESLRSSSDRAATAAEQH